MGDRHTLTLRFLHSLLQQLSVDGFMSGLDAPYQALETYLFRFWPDGAGFSISVRSSISFWFTDPAPAASSYSIPW